MTNPFQPQGVTAAHNLMNYGHDPYSSRPPSYPQAVNNSPSAVDKASLLALLREVRQEIMSAPATNNHPNVKRREFISILFNMCTDTNLGRYINSQSFFFGFFSNKFFRVVSAVTGYNDIEACMSAVSDNQHCEQDTSTANQQYNGSYVNTQNMGTNNYGQFQLSSRTSSNNASVSQSQQAQAWYRMPDERMKQREPPSETLQFHGSVNGYSVGPSAPATGSRQPYTESGMFSQGISRVPPLESYNQYNTQQGHGEEYNPQQRAASFQQAVPEQANHFGMLLPNRAQEQPVRPREGNHERPLPHPSRMSSTANGISDMIPGSLQKSIERQREVLSQATAQQRVLSHQPNIGYPSNPGQVNVSRKSSPPISTIPIDKHNLPSHSRKPAQFESGSKRSRVKPDSKEHLKQLLAASKIAESSVRESPTEPSVLLNSNHVLACHANIESVVQDDVLHKTKDASSNNPMSRASENRTPSVVTNSDQNADTNVNACSDKTGIPPQPVETNHVSENENISRILSMPILFANAAEKDNVMCNTVNKGTDAPRSLGIYDPPLPVIKHKKREHRISPYKKDAIESDHSSNASDGSVEQHSDSFRKGLERFRASFDKESLASLMDNMSSKKAGKNNTLENISSSELEQTDLGSKSEQLKLKHRHKSAEVSSSSSPKSGSTSLLTNENQIDESNSLKETKEVGHGQKMAKFLATHEFPTRKNCSESSIDVNVDTVAGCVSAREKVYSKWSGSRKLIGKEKEIVSKVRRNSHSGHGAVVKARKSKRSASWNGPFPPVATTVVNTPCQLGMTDELKARSVSPDSTVLPNKHASRLARKHSDPSHKNVNDHDNLQLNKVSSQSTSDHVSEMLYSDVSMDSDDVPSDTDTYVYADGSPITKKVCGEEHDPLLLKKSKQLEDNTCDNAVSGLEQQDAATEPDCPATEETQYMQEVWNSTREYILKSFVALRRQHQNLLDENSKMKLDMMSKEKEISSLQKERDNYKEMLEKTFETYSCDDVTDRIGSP